MIFLVTVWLEFFFWKSKSRRLFPALFSLLYLPPPYLRPIPVFVFFALPYPPFFLFSFLSFLYYLLSFLLKVGPLNFS